MPDAPARVVGPTQLGTSMATLYTVPASTTLIIRHIRLVNVSAGTVAGIRLQIGAGDDAALRVVPDLSLTKGATYDWSGFMVLTTGELLRGRAGTATAINVIINGVLIT